MATQQDFTQAKQISRNYYDSQNERELAARQLISAKDNATSAALENGYNDNKDSTSPDYAKSAYNPKNWGSDQTNKVNSANSNYTTKALDEKAQMQAVANYITTKDGLSPEEKQNALLAAGLKPSDVSRSLYSSKPNELQEQVLQDRAEAIRNQASENTPILEEKIATNAEKTSSLSANLDQIQMDPNSTAADIKKAQDALDSAKAEGITLQQQAEENNEKLEISSSTALAKQQLDSENNLSASNLPNTIKLANTGFETIKNGAPFYMQMPTLQSITDFKLKNGYSPYGDTSINTIARDAVNFRIFESVPGVAKADVIPGTKLVRNTIDDSRIQSVGSFTIYPADMNWLSQQHSHTYGGGDDWLASTVNSLGEGLSNIGNLMNAVAGGAQALGAGSTKGLPPAGDSFRRRVEVMKYYQDSAPQSLSINFNLFTKRDFLNDVFRPIMFLTALGYPKRVLQTDASATFNNFISGVRQYAQNGNNFAQQLLQAYMPGEGITNIASKTFEWFEEQENKIASFGGIGPYRYFISKRPEYLSVRHVSGLFNFPLANITGFNYNFKGPWYNYEGKPLVTGGRDLDQLISQKINNFAPNPNAPLSERLGSIFKNFATEAAAAWNSNPKTAGRPTGTPGSLAGLISEDMNMVMGRHATSMNHAYPSYAECTITIQSSIPFFRDDYMALYNASTISPEELVSVTQKNTGDERFYGGRKSTSNQAF